MLNKYEINMKKIEIMSQDGNVNVGGKFTPAELCQEILDKIDVVDKKILTFNVEFVLTLVHKYNVKKPNITIYTDDNIIRGICERCGIKCIDTMEPNMKFDVVIGNPPFKNGNETGGRGALWRKFVSKSWELLLDNGSLSMVTPRFPNSSHDLGHIFVDNQTTAVWTDISHHFSGVGSSFFAWSVTKTPKYTTTEFVDEGLKLDVTSKTLPKDLRSIPIIDKVMGNPLFECKSSPEYTATSVADGNDDKRLYSKKTAAHTYALRRTSGENYKMWGITAPTDYTSPKVVMTFSGYPHYKFHDSSDPIGTIKQLSGHILVNNEVEGENLINLFNSSLYKYIQNQLATGGMRGKAYYGMPKLDITKSWSDSDVYEHFKLTAEEIEMIEQG